MAEVVDVEEDAVAAVMAVAEEGSELLSCVRCFPLLYVCRVSLLTAVVL
jgi:hypothetical protein